MTVNIVEINGHQYRYEYDLSTKKTLYRGPVGSAPALYEEEFQQVMMGQLNPQMEGLTYLWLRRVDDHAAEIWDYVVQHHLDEMELPLSYDFSDLSEDDAEYEMGKIDDTIGEMVEFYTDDLIAGRPAKTPLGYYQQFMSGE